MEEKSRGLNVSVRSFLTAIVVILVLMVGFTLPGFVQVFLYNKVLIKLETAGKDDLDEGCMN